MKNTSPSYSLVIEKSEEGKVEEHRIIVNPEHYIAPRPILPVDSLEGDGDARDTVRKRPPQKWKTTKKITRKLKEAEEWVWYIQKKLGNT